MLEKDSNVDQLIDQFKTLPGGFCRYCMQLSSFLSVSQIPL